ncbi:DUF58 domain-containing protein [Isoptericola variabilis]|uniref:DUF58 domain-containing protein n=1 Tax=Isoptericola variabilis (strain 225) TaxID=743718 RepID=F6FRM0_ISOV2|nr:DUF58 domain-containing protein [Isoptericola variabilis]AEG45078.1 protein of unknown function DUF58 [Isoptericola variabilis 225]TWH26208.1 uncharacterized protein (DUF58 family) [Isoptericola variabilis J7]
MALTRRAVWLAAAGIVPVLLVPSAGTVVVWAVLVAVLCAVDVALAASPREVAVRRDVPASVRLGTPTASALVLTNRSGRRLRARVRDAWPPSMLTDAATGLARAVAASTRHDVDVAPGESVRVRTPLLPTRRGDRRAGDVTVRSFGPLRLAARQASLPVPGRVRVLPEFASRRHLPSRLARLREMDGRAAVQVRGEGTEFDSLREYVVGDDVRSIDWRATARRGDVVVRTWRPERDRRVVVVLDTGRTSAARIDASDGGASAGATRLEASIEAALLLAALADRAGDRVQVLAYDRTLRGRVAGASGPRLLPELAETLATVEPALLETDWHGLVGQVRSRVSQRALVVLLTALDPAAVESGLLPVVDQLTGTHQVVVAAVADAEVAALRAGRDDVAQVYDAAAAARGELERAAVAAVLRRRGAEVVEALPDDLAPQLADTYLALKAAGRL